MNRFRLTFLAPALAIALFGAAAGMKTYTAPAYHVSVTYPASWIDKGVAKLDLLDPNYNGPYNSFGFGPKMDGEILVSVVSSPPMTRDEFFAAFKKLLDQMPMKLAAQNVSDLEVNGLSGFQFDYGAGTEIGRVHVAVFYANGKRYSIQTMGFDERKGEYDSYAPTIDQVFRSFKLVAP